jgi:predicted GNAT family N-acyltransferase
MENLNSIKIHIANHKWEKEKIYQLRYNIFIEEMSKHCQVDHKSKQMRDDLDDQSILLYAECNSELIGTSRITMAEPKHFPNWLSNIFALDKFEKILGPNAKVAFSTKVAIVPSYRGSTVMYQLIAEHFKIFKENNINVSFSGSNPHLIAMYERIGYRRFTKNFSEPGHGLLIPFVIILDDTDYLRAVHSPLYRLIEKNPNRSIVTEHFKQVFPQTSYYINTQLTKKEQLWEQLRKVFNGTTQTDLNLISHLNEKERIALFNLSAIFTCTNGDCILSNNEVSNGLFFVLSGSILGESANQAFILRNGQYFGDGLSQQQPSTYEFTSLNDSELLILPRQAFEKYKQLYPKAAMHIITSLKNQNRLTPGSHSDVRRNRCEA